MLIAERVKTVIPAAPGVRVVGYRCDSRWTPEYVATHDDLLWTAPVVLWSVYVRCFRDEGEYTEDVDIRGVTAGRHERFAGLRLGIFPRRRDRYL